MDMHRAEDIAGVGRGHAGRAGRGPCAGADPTHVRDYEAFMEGLRNGTLKHTGDRDLRAHVLNAIARRLPGGDLRFDRPNPSRGSSVAQDRRVIDGLTAAAMVVEFSNNAEPQVSVYEQRGLVGA